MIVYTLIKKKKKTVLNGERATKKLANTSESCQGHQKQSEKMSQLRGALKRMDTVASWNRKGWGISE